ncbi:hypothetical protein FDECE_6440 [Fusarium decemcellulare]|nr:hypothetical protein FDECE_6440 [Fusarium decemcellulare]
MLRVRRGAGSPASFAHICRSYLRCPRQCLPLRSFATETNSDASAKPSSDSNVGTGDTLTHVNASSPKLDARVEELNKDGSASQVRISSATRKKKKRSKPTDDGTPANTKAKSEDAEFDEALNVVRRVYGVDKLAAARKKKKGKASKHPKPEPPSETTSSTGMSTANDFKSWSIAQQAGMWTSLREKLQHQTAPQPPDSEQVMAHSPPLDKVSLGAQDVYSADLGEITPTSNVAEPPALEKTKEARSEKTEKSTGTKFDPLLGKTKKMQKEEDMLEEVMLEVEEDKLEVKVVVPRKLVLEPVEEDMTLKVPRLAHNLDKVLFNPGVYQLQDRRSRVYNFDPQLAKIMPVKEFDFNALKEYVTSSKDTRLRALSAKHGKRFCGSTSSLTSLLSHFHFLLSAWRKPNFSHLSRDFKVEFDSFTTITRGPAAVFARYKDGVYAIDADKEYDTANVLSMLGKSMEKHLTLPKEEFEKYRKTRSHQLSEEEKNADEAFHYTTFGDFMLRSQLDAYDPRLPGSGMFDLKTRAVVSIRMDVTGYEKGVGYEIINRFGTWESFEREYYDMIRSAFLKYSLQVRMGRMDGIFVAFHNTQRIFGFQYVSIEEMDRALHGTSNTRLGDDEFKVSLQLLNEVLDRASKRFPKRSLRLHIETRPTKTPLTYFFAQPVDEDQIDRTQEKGKANIDKFEKEILGLSRQESEAESRQLVEEMAAQAEQERLDLQDEQEQDPNGDLQKQQAWDEMMAKVDKMVENDSLGLQSVRDAVEQAMEQSGLLAGKSEMERNAYLDKLVKALAEELSGDKEMGIEPKDTQQTEDEPKEVSQAMSDDLSQTFEGENVLLQSYQSAKDGKASDVDSTQAASESSGEKKPQTAPENVPGETDSLRTQVSPENNGSDSDVDSVQASLELAAEGKSEFPSESHEMSVDDGSSVGDESSTEAIDDMSPSNDELPKGSLKDLILKVAQGVDNKASDMGTFELVLSELVEAQKSTGTENEEEVDTSDLDAALPEDISLLEGGEKAKTEAAEASKNDSKTGGSQGRELFGAYITVRNRVGAKVVERFEIPDNTSPSKKWVVEYTITELPHGRARTILRQLRRRREKALKSDPGQKDKQWQKLWGGRLVRTAESGRQYRKLLAEEETQKGLKVAWDEKPILPNKQSRGLKKRLKRKSKSV